MHRKPLTMRVSIIWSEIHTIGGGSTIFVFTSSVSSTSFKLRLKSISAVLLCVELFCSTFNNLLQQRPSPIVAAYSSLTYNRPWYGGVNSTSVWKGTPRCAAERKESEEPGNSLQSQIETDVHHSIFDHLNLFKLRTRTEPSPANSIRFDCPSINRGRSRNRLKLSILTRDRRSSSIDDLWLFKVSGGFASQLIIVILCSSYYLFCVQTWLIPVTYIIYLLRWRNFSLWATRDIFFIIMRIDC